MANADTAAAAAAAAAACLCCPVLQAAHKEWRAAGSEANKAASKARALLTQQWVQVVSSSTPPHSQTGCPQTLLPA